MSQGRATASACVGPPPRLEPQRQAGRGGHWPKERQRSRMNAISRSLLFCSTPQFSLTIMALKPSLVSKSTVNPRHQRAR